DVEVHEAFLDLGREIVEADDVGAGVLCGFRLLALREHGDTPLLAGAGGGQDRPAGGLVRLFRIDAEIDGDVDRFVELGDGRRLHELQRLVERIGLAVLHFRADGLHALRQLRFLLLAGHDHFTPSTVMPMLRALPAIVRTAASMSAAVRSGIFVFAISSACARVNLPTLSALGRWLPLSTFAAFMMSTVAGGVFMMNVKLLSAYAVITTGIGSPGSTFCV